LSCPWAVLARTLVEDRLRSGGRGTGSLGDEPWAWIAWALAEATWRCLQRKKSVRGPKLRQATQIPTQRTVPTLTLQHAEHIVQLDLASTAGRIAHAPTQQTLLALQGSALDQSMRLSKGGRL